MVAALAATASSCVDEDFDLPGDPGEGFADAKFSLGFMPMSEADNDTGGGSSRGTVAPPGNGMNYLDKNDVCLLFYNEDGSLFNIYSAADFLNFKVSDAQRDNNDVPQGDGTSGVAAESNTKQAEFSIRNVPFGKYYIYAVANLGYWSGGTSTTTLQELRGEGHYEGYADAIQTMEGLRSIRLKWDASNYRNNRQMLGYVVPKGSQHDAPSMSQVAPLITFSNATTSLHSWLKRAASKVTITFNGSKLRDNVRVYIRRATIHDIPAECQLGEGNTVTDAEGLIQKSSHHLDFGDGDNYTAWPSVSRGDSTFDDELWNHNPDSPYALYFFENRQGDFSNHPDKDRYDKRQWPADDGSVIDKADRKDNVPFGTYIEVEGYYVSRNDDQVTNGKIIYRFMLGQDIYYNFDATRNCHYKLTLNFRGNGNEVDWHIEYNEEFPQLYLPEKFYISYLYNREVHMPVRVNTGNSYELVNLGAEILCNNWAPSVPSGFSAPVPTGSGNYQFTFNQGYYNSHSKSRVAYINDIANNWTEEANNFDLTKYNTDTIVGFLSLRKPKKVTILEDITSASTVGTKVQDYWRDNQLGHRAYEFPTTLTTTTYDNTPGGPGSYTVTKSDSTYTFSIPMYTRAKQLSPWLAYTANNPYPYPRHAVVRVTATFRDVLSGEIIRRSKRIIVEQVERIQNPKGIWRDWNEDGIFNVELVKRDPNDLNRFISIESDGPWRAEVAAGADWIKLNGRLNYVVQGATGTPIKFTYQPDGKLGDASQVRYGVIRIHYNNYTCDHLIFVRQGYASQEVFTGGSKWSVYNLFSKNELAKSPLSAGSYFRCGNLDQAILESNNDRAGFGFGATPGTLWVRNADKTRSNVTWANIGCFRSTDWDANNALTFTKTGSGKANVSLGNNMFENITINGKTYHVATYDDYRKLMDEANFGYGVLYCGGASNIQKTVAGAFEFKDFDNTGTVNKEKGMRGIFAYNAIEGNQYYGRQIFFPITAIGHGRRKAWISEGSNNGVLRYGDVKDAIEPPRIMVYDLNQTPGAMYWLRAGRKNGHVEGGASYNAFSWDMNYYTFGFGTYHRYVFRPDARGSDALLIKLIEQ